MAESVRLVVWDLDETFWGGTLSEGGIRFRPENRAIVIELARRGIMSSICSKNDFETVRRVCVEHEVWQYFIFPSITWDPKGPRLASLVEDVQLRAPTILFVDDNPQNLAEAEHFVPGIQTRTETFVGAMLNDPLLAGKPDPDLTRLARYKVLEQRKSDEVKAGPDTIDFLRGSDIRVAFEYDLTTHLDRVVELINRTNQLNFCKSRLSENAEQARLEALKLVSSASSQGALLRVRDRYGDHGYCGLYIYDSEGRRLKQFCFSCRVLGMGIEQWLYNRLGRPKIAVQGEVLSDLFDQTRPYDWIVLGSGVADSNSRQSSGVDFGAITARGGCEIGAIMHYFSTNLQDVHTEYNVHRSGSTFRIDHSVFLRKALETLTAEELDVAEKLGYLAADFETRVFQSLPERHVVMLSFTADAMHALYRHRQTGLVLPFMYPGCNPMLDLRGTDPVRLPRDPSARWLHSAVNVLRDEFEFIGPIGEKMFSDNLEHVFAAIPRSSQVIVLEANDHHVDWATGTRTPVNQFARPNQWARAVAQGFSNISVVATRDFIRSREDLPMHHGRHDIIHYDRQVYFRIYEHLANEYGKHEPAFAH